MTIEYSRGRQALMAMPFVAAPEGLAGRFDLWVDRGTGHWAQDCLTGRKYADAAARYMAETDDIPLISAIVRRMGELGVQTGIDVGFLTRIGALTMSAAQAGLNPIYGVNVGGPRR